MPSFRFIESDRRITPLNLKKYQRIEFNFELYESVYIENTGNVLDIWLRWTFNVASYRWLQQEVKKKKKTLSYEYFKLEKWFIQQPFADSNTLTNQKEKKKKKIFAHLQRTHRSNRRKPSLFRIESRVHSNLPKNQTSDSDQSIKEKKSATNNF